MQPSGGFLFDLIADYYDAVKCPRVTLVAEYPRLSRGCSPLPISTSLAQSDRISMAMRLSLRLRWKILTQAPRGCYETRYYGALFAGRSFDSFSAQAASVDSFLQNVKRIWLLPILGSS